MQTTITTRSNSEDFWKLKIKRNKALSKKAVAKVGRKVVKSVRSGMLEGEKRKAKLTPSYRARRVRYGRLRTAVRGKFLPAKAARRKNLIAIYLVTAMGFKKRPLPNAYWIRFLIYGTPERRTKKGYNRGRIKPHRFLWARRTQAFRQGVLGPEVAKALKQATKEAAEGAKMKVIK